MAVATGPAQGGVGILRLSGPSALSVALRFARGVPAPPSPRRAYFSTFVDGKGARLDEGLFLYFAAPASFTGEDVVELQAHGSPALLALLQAEFLAGGEARLAAPGEFTQRAFVNGKLDLSRAEAVAELVTAGSEAQVRAASARASGEWAARIAALKDPLSALHAELEGELNFPDEAGEAREVSARLTGAVTSARALLTEASRSSLARRGARVVLHGPVNAGKSSLFNALLGSPRALVDAEPGTTRDVLEATLSLDGLTVTLVDTAGLSGSPGRVEALGIERARAAMAGADLVIQLVPPGASAAALDQRELRVASKADLGAGSDGLAVSAVTGRGLEALKSRLAEVLWSGAASASAATSDRHADALRRCVQALERAQVAEAKSTLEVVAGEVGLAAAALGEITGEDANAAVIDAIFRRFCIGK